MRRDQRGVVYLETLIAFLPVFALFLGVIQVVDVSTAHLVVQHASATAARAAVVVLPDDGIYYGDQANAELDHFPEGPTSSARVRDVERAADLILAANPRLHVAGPNVFLDKEHYAFRDDLTALVVARYRCLIPPLCGSGFDLVGRSTLVYQGAAYEYELNDARNFREDPPADGDRGRGADPVASARGQTRRSRDDDRPSDLGEVASPPLFAGAAMPPSRPPLSAEDRKKLLEQAGGCFVAGTGIATPGGVRPIDSLSTGELVYAHDDATGSVVVRPVERTFVRTSPGVVDLTVRFAGGGAITITGTANHPFYVPSAGAYVELAWLTPGTSLLTDDGRPAEVADLSVREGTYEVFNFSVAGEHNYYVTGSSDPPSGILVHNQVNPCGPQDPKRQAALDRQKKRTTPGVTHTDKITRDGKHITRTRTAEPVADGDRYSDGSAIPAGTTRVSYTDGTYTTVYYLDEQGRTIRVEAPQMLATAVPKGYTPQAPDRTPGRDDRGHLAPERLSPEPYLVNVGENIVAENAKESNQGPKRDWEDAMRDQIAADLDPNVKWSTVHIPEYRSPTDLRPYQIHHILYRNGVAVMGFDVTIPNPE